MLKVEGSRSKGEASPAGPTSHSAPIIGNCSSLGGLLFPKIAMVGLVAVGAGGLPRSAGHHNERQRRRFSRQMSWAEPL
ncbi:hypothetical protein [Kribbella sp. NBC_00889]|uniref:hypothetical protein n=1 Tax=Kribbella sp. NBC_00889 TaxID=2975974 RepID=UPI00386AABAA|nr:hypothetical protein OG817_26620 [Kribbella sp. NBC_00889]